METTNNNRPSVGLSSGAFEPVSVPKDCLRERSSSFLLCSSKQNGRCGNKFSMTKYRGFTLVELIVVITILVILGTIAFIQLGGFAGSARDSARVSNMTSLKKGLDTFQIKSGSYPLPENLVNITASGTVIGYQGFAQDLIGSIAGLSKGGTLDPSDATIYTTYSVNANQTKMQLMNFLEDSSTVTAFIPNAYANQGSDYSKRSPVTKGDTLGILLASGSLQPVQESGTGVDIMTTNTGFTAYFSNKITIFGTGVRLVSLKASYTQKNDPMIYDTSLVGYWDMETLDPSGKLADLSGNGNNGTLSGTIMADGRQGKGRLFSVNSEGINLGKLFKNNIDAVTISLLVKEMSGNPLNTMPVLFRVVENNSLTGAILSIQRDRRIIPNDLDYLFGGDVGNAPGNLRRIMYGKDNAISSTGTLIIPKPALSWQNTNTYHLLTLVIKDNNTTSVSYLDGLKVGEITYPLNQAINLSSGDVILGNNIQYSQGYDGIIDEARIYNRALSDSEIFSLYNATK
ncbi:MAG: prepilin-type N-terminal cleavage/methylation domain-containing protein [Candidatus Gracilibacteria bacterium]|nr:prepilin-type N-terminal cleavage/methylation domain-containing protein [Candidatus Gracilibacteria bacterium]